MAASKFNEISSCMCDNPTPLHEPKPTVVHSDVVCPASDKVDALRQKLAAREGISAVLSAIGSAIKPEDRHGAASQFVSCLKKGDVPQIQYALRRLMAGLLSSNAQSFGLALACFLENCPCPAEELVKALQFLSTGEDPKSKVHSAKTYVFAAIASSQFHNKVPEADQEKLISTALTFLLQKVKRNSNLSELATRTLLQFLHTSTEVAVKATYASLKDLLPDITQYTANLLAIAFAIQTKIAQLHKVPVELQKITLIDLSSPQNLNQLAAVVGPQLIPAKDKDYKGHHHVWQCLVDFIFAQKEHNLCDTFNAVWKAFVTVLLDEPEKPPVAVQGIRKFLITESIYQILCKVEDDHIKSQLLWQMHNYMHTARSKISPLTFRGILEKLQIKIPVHVCKRHFLTVSEVHLEGDDEQAKKSFRESLQLMLLESSMRLAQQNADVVLPALEFLFKQALYIVPHDVPNKDVLHKGDLTDQVVRIALKSGLNLLILQSVTTPNVMVTLVKQLADWSKEYSSRVVWTTQVQEDEEKNIPNCLEAIQKVVQRVSSLLPDNKGEKGKKKKDKEDPIQELVILLGCVYISLITLHDENLCPVAADIVRYVDEEVCNAQHRAWGDIDVFVEMLLGLEGYQIVGVDSPYDHLHVLSVLHQAGKQMFKAIAASVPAEAMASVVSAIEDPEGALNIEGDDDDDDDIDVESGDDTVEEVEEVEEVEDEDGTAQVTEDTIDESKPFVLPTLNPFLGDDDDENTPDLDDEQMMKLDAAMAGVLRKMKLENQGAKAVQDSAQEFQYCAAVFFHTWLDHNKGGKVDGAILDFVVPLLGTVHTLANIGSSRIKRRKKAGLTAKRELPPKAQRTLKECTAILTKLATLSGTRSPKNAEAVQSILAFIAKQADTTTEIRKALFSLLAWVVQFAPPSAAISKEIGVFFRDVSWNAAMPLRTALLQRPDAFATILVPAAVEAFRKAKPSHGQASIADFLRGALKLLVKLPASSAKDALCAELRKDLQQHAASPVAAKPSAVDGVSAIIDAFVGLMPTPPAADKRLLLKQYSGLARAVENDKTHRWAETVRLGARLGVDKKDLPKKEHKHKEDKPKRDRSARDSPPPPKKAKGKKRPRSDTSTKSTAEAAAAVGKKQAAAARGKAGQPEKKGKPSKGKKASGGETAAKRAKKSK